MSIDILTYLRKIPGQNLKLGPYPDFKGNLIFIGQIFGRTFVLVMKRAYI